MRLSDDLLRNLSRRDRAAIDQRDAEWTTMVRAKVHAHHKLGEAWRSVREAWLDWLKENWKGKVRPTVRSGGQLDAIWDNEIEPQVKGKFTLRPRDVGLNAWWQRDDELGVTYQAYQEKVGPVDLVDVIASIQDTNWPGVHDARDAALKRHLRGDEAKGAMTIARGWGETLPESIIRSGSMRKSVSDLLEDLSDVVTEANGGLDTSVRDPRFAIQKLPMPVHGHMSALKQLCVVNTKFDRIREILADQNVDTVSLAAHLKEYVKAVRAIERHAKKTANIVGTFAKGL